MFKRMSFRTALLVCVSLGSLSLANQALGQTTTPQQNIDINQLLQSLGGLGLGGVGGLGGLTGTSTGTTTGTTTGATTGTTTGTTTGQGQRVPGVIGNQFTANGQAAISQRRPGLFIQQAFALQNGQLTLPGTPAPVEPNFLRDTADQIAQSVIDVIKGLFTSLNTGISLLSGVPITGATGGTTIANPATTGAGTTTTLQ